jgi:hypothetical protein
VEKTVLLVKDNKGAFYFILLSLVKENKIKAIPLLVISTF